jgi:hypothetical protein
MVVAQAGGQRQEHAVQHQRSPNGYRDPPERDGDEDGAPGARIVAHDAM